jgi:hypothetical protein
VTETVTGSALAPRSLRIILIPACSSSGASSQVSRGCENGWWGPWATGMVLPVMRAILATDSNPGFRAMSQPSGLAWRNFSVMCRTTPRTSYSSSAKTVARSIWSSGSWGGS